MNDGSGGKDYLLLYPCMLANGEWVTAVSGSAWGHQREAVGRNSYEDANTDAASRTGVMNSRGFADRRPSGKRMRHIIEEAVPGTTYTTAIESGGRIVIPDVLGSNLKHLFLHPTSIDPSARRAI